MTSSINAAVAITVTMMMAMVSPSLGFQSVARTHASLAPPSPYSTSTSTTRTTTSLAGIFDRGNKKEDNDEETFIPGKKMNVARRKKLGINDDEEEYDLEFALENNTDPLITKIIVGSLYASILTLLIFGFIIPYTTDYGDGVCNALRSGGRC